MLQPAPDKRPYIPIAFISDTHLFKENAQTDQLVELLKNVRFGAIFFMGDWEDSLYRDREQRLRGAPPPVPDGVLRVFDILNQKRLEEGTGLFLCPGNHDNGYRALLDPERQREREEMESLLGMKIIPPFILKTNEGKEYLAFHGDHLDSRFVRHVLYDLGDAMYGVVQKLAGGSAASLAKKFFKLFENVLNLDRRLFHEAERFGTDGTISGHTHLPGHKFVARKGRVIETFNTCFMDGDSIFLAVDEKGGLDLVDWSQRRIELGLDRDPPAVENTGAIYRDLSLKQVFGIMAMKPLPPAQEDRYINLPDPEKISVIRQSDLMKTFARAAENSLPEDAASFTPPRPPMPPEYGQGLAPG